MFITTFLLLNSVGYPMSYVYLWNQEITYQMLLDLISMW
jgi:hypothetical protein